MVDTSWEDVTDDPFEPSRKIDRPPRKPNGHDTDPTLPVVTVYNGLRHTAADEGLAALSQAKAPFYQRDRQLVRTSTAKAKTSDGAVVEIPCIVGVTQPMLARALGSAAEWEKVLKDGERRRIDPPGDVVEQIGAMFGHWPFPPIAGIIGTPTLRPDGSLLTKPGYDEATGLVLVSPPPMAPIPDAPTRAQAEAAFDMLFDGLLGEFPFADEPSRAVAASMLLTTILRGALLPAVPMHASTAPQPGTGKSYLQDIASALATGERCAVIAVSPDVRETESRLIGAALAGQQIIALDNCSDMLFGDFLNQVTERPVLQLRRLGSSEMVRIPNTFTVFANGNNLLAPADLVRRTLVCRLDADCENPEEREFRHDPVATILADRGRYIGACLTIARGYLAAGSPDQRKPLPSFERWSNLVRSALVWLGMDDPCDSMNLARAEDPIRAARAAVFNSWSQEIEMKPLGILVPELIELAEERDGFGMRRPNWREACLLVAEDRKGGFVSPRRLGKWLASNNNNRVGDLKLTVNREDPSRLRWILSKG